MSEDPTSAELVVLEPNEHVPVMSPGDRLRQAVLIADTLSSVIEQRHLYVQMGNRRHVLAEGWQVLAQLMNVSLEIEWSRPLESGHQGWEARAIARRDNGQILGSAEAQCARDEEQWASRPDHALRSMACTRATSRALRQSIGFIVKLSGFDATPAEEMPAPAMQPAPEPPDMSPPAAGARASGPAWLDDKIGFGKHKDKTWRRFLDGSKGGEGEGYLQYLISDKFAPETDRARQAKQRANSVLDMRFVNEGT
jgi:hypothetical protein